MSEATFQTLLKPDRPVGIVGYGAYVPRYRLPAREVARIWTGGAGGVPIKEKAVPGMDEDVANLLRKVDKPVFLAVNKVDNAKRAEDAVEFYLTAMNIVKYPGAKGKGIKLIIRLTI